MNEPQVVYVAAKVGCLECGKDTSVEVFTTPEAAQARLEEWKATANVPEANAFLMYGCVVQP